MTCDLCGIDTKPINLWKLQKFDYVVFICDNCVKEKLGLTAEIEYKRITEEDLEDFSNLKGARRER